MIKLEVYNGIHSVKPERIAYYWTHKQFVLDLQGIPQTKYISVIKGNICLYHKIKAKWH